MKKIKLLTNLSSIAVIGTSIPIVATSCGKDDKEELVDPSINVVPNKDAGITGGNTVEQPIDLGSFMLFDDKEKLVKTDETSNLRVAFTGTNDSGFTNANIKFQYKPASSTYGVTLTSGTANNTTCVGYISMTWTVDDKRYTSTTNLTISVTKKGAKTLAKEIYSPDFKLITGEDPTIPVILNSGIYLDVTDPLTGTRINAKWIILGGGTFVELINKTDITSINGLKVNLLPSSQSAAAITVKAIPEDTSYEEAEFTFNIKQAEGAEVAIITASKGATGDGYPVLQFEPTQAIVNDVFTFKLNGASAEITDVSWSVIAATGGLPSDVSFGTGADANKLTVNTVNNSTAEYTIQASYGDGLTANFILKLFAGATVSATYKVNASAGSSTPIPANTEITNDLAVGNVITVSIDNFESEVDYWTAEYEDVIGVHSIPGFISPTSNKSTAIWTVNDLDIENIPASAYITFRAYKSNSEHPLGTFMFQAKVHMLSNIEGWSPWRPEDNKWIRFPWFFSTFSKADTTPIELVKSGSTGDTTGSGARGKIDGANTWTSITPTFISDPIHDYYTVVDNSTSTRIYLTNSAIGKSLQVTIRFTVPVPDAGGVKILVYSTVDFLKINA